MLSDNSDQKTILAYHGPIDMDVLSFFGKMIKRIFIHGDHSLSTRIYKIYIELVQNISYYSAEMINLNGHEIGSGAFEIVDTGNTYQVRTKNLVYKADGHKLLKNCSEINTLNAEELRMLKRMKRRELVQIDTGAHIGLIHVGLLAKDKLDYKIEEMNNDYSLFNISINIKK